jgi:hypothetical protein
MGFYILVIEFSFDRVANLKGNMSKAKLYWLIKYITFNTMYIPMLLFLPKLVYQGEINPIIIVVMLLAGQVVLFVYDMAYRSFQTHIWGRVRNKLTL